MRTSERERDKAAKHAISAFPSCRATPNRREARGIDAPNRPAGRASSLSNANRKTKAPRGASPRSDCTGCLRTFASYVSSFQLERLKLGDISRASGDAISAPLSRALVAPVARRLISTVRTMVDGGWWMVGMECYFQTDAVAASKNLTSNGLLAGRSLAKPEARRMTPLLVAELGSPYRLTKSWLVLPWRPIRSVNM